MGSCSKNGEGEMNGTVGVEVNSCSEIKKEIAVVGDPTDDIKIDDIMAGGDNLMFSDEGLFTSLADFHYLSSPAPSSASITLPQDLSSSSSSSSSSTYPWSYIDVPGPSKEPHMMQQGQDQLDQMMVPSADASAEDILAGFDLWDASNPLDPSFLFADDYDTALETPLQKCEQAVAGNGGDGGGDDNSGGNELGRIFFDWLRNNRGKISMEDLRSIRLKRSTIDSAAARLGPGDEGRKDLLRLILAWVQNSHLKKRRMEAQDPPPESVLQFYNNYQPAQQQQQQQVVPSLSALAYNSPQYQFSALLDAAANPNSNLDYNNCEGGWNMYYGSMENPMLPVPALQSMIVSAGDAALMNPYHPYYLQSGSTGNIVVNSQPLSPSPDFHSFSPPPIQYPPFPGLGIPRPHPIPKYTRGFGSQYPVYLSPHLTGAALATKEARMKRMARQRRYSVLNQHKNQSHSQHSSLNAATVGQNANLSPRNERGGSSSMTNISMSNNVKNLAFWSSCWQRNLPTNAATAGSAPPLPAKTSNMQQSLLQQRNGASSSDMLQPSKKNMRFVLQKVLKQSDVGSLGRIVLPKKEAELHLPELDSRDGMSIPMEDIGTSQVWNMKYRFWPNNKSRMYLLENAGDFVKSNGLQEGDFIVIYLDVKHNKYMIRGVKVRQPVEPKEVGAAGVRLNGAGSHLNNSSDHLNSTSRTAAVFDLENNENNEDEGLLSFSEEDGGASPLMIMGDDI